MEAYTYIKDIILEHSISKPNREIISDSSRSLTWKQFIRLVEDFREILESQKNHANRVCFFAERNISSVAVMVACFLAKKCFVPIDPEQPEERIKQMLTTIGCNSILKPSERKFIKFRAHLNNTSSNLEFNEICYILFTSGSSGTPKAVQITHKNLLNTILWGTEQFEWLDGDVIGIPTKFSFDISLFDVFTSLVLSKKMYIFGAVDSPSLFYTECNAAKVTSIFTTPSLFVMLNRHKLFNKLELRRIISGGDFFPTKDLIDIFNNNKSLKIYNIWGPTETTIINTCHLVSIDDMKLLHEKNLVPVGKASARMQIIVCDVENEFEIVEIPTGEIGEVVVLGDSVSPGYLNYSDNSGLATGFKEFRGSKAYRTGDIGFFDSHKRLFISGRNKQFIKYQGFRIDPREVEFIADKYKAVDKSVLSLVANDSDELTLVMIIVCNQEIDITHLKIYLRDNLPKYMIPKYIIEVPSIPLSSNGKIDRQAAEKIAISQLNSLLQNK